MPVFWIQAAIGFVLWVAYGWFLSRRSMHVRGWFQSWSSRSLILAGIGLLVGSFALIFGLVVGLHQAGALSATGMPGWAWLILTGAGLGFVHAQSTATAIFVSLAQRSVTTPPDPTSRTTGINNP